MERSPTVAVSDVTRHAPVCAAHHDPEFHDDGTMLGYDNGSYDQAPAPGQHSRVVEYQIDEASMKATLIWEFPGSFAMDDAWYPNDWFSDIWGDADELPNGNVLVTAGIRAQGSEDRIFEVRRDDGKVVWAIRMPMRPNNMPFGNYRAERLSPPPLVETVGQN